MSMRKNPGLAAVTSRMSPIQAALEASLPADIEQQPSSTAAAPPETTAAPVPISLRLPRATHESLRRIAFDGRVSIHSLILEGVKKFIADPEGVKKFIAAEKG